MAPARRRRVGRYGYVVFRSRRMPGLWRHRQDLRMPEMARLERPLLPCRYASAQMPGGDGALPGVRGDRRGRGAASCKWLRDGKRCVDRAPLRHQQSRARSRRSCILDCAATTKWRSSSGSTSHATTASASEPHVRAVDRIILRMDPAKDAEQPVEHPRRRDAGLEPAAIAATSLGVLSVEETGIDR